MKKLLTILTLSALFACNADQTGGDIMGYKYEHIVQNDGPKAGPGDYLFYDYYLRNDKNEILEASKEKGGVSEFRIPAEDAYPKKAALIELMKIMSEGDSARLFYPIDSLPATGSRFGQTQTLVYELVIRDVMNDQEYQAFSAEKNAEMQAIQDANAAKVDDIAAKVQETLSQYKSGGLDGQLKMSGPIEYVIHEEGTGENIKRKDNVVAHYYGVLKSDGSMFDNSFGRGQPFTFVNGKGMVIPGWDEGFKLLKKGGAATLFIPYHMAYGEQGRPPQIPEKADLVFYVEVVDVQAN